MQPRWYSSVAWRLTHRLLPIESPSSPILFTQLWKLFFYDYAMCSLNVPTCRKSSVPLAFSAKAVSNCFFSCDQTGPSF